MNPRHLSTAFEDELADLSARVLDMGRLAVSQVEQASYALGQADQRIAADVLANEVRVNRMEIDIDSELSSIISRRQPAARDLRLLLATSKATANLERVGDEAARIARAVQRSGRAVAGRASGEDRVAPMPAGVVADGARLAVLSLRHALAALAQLDATLAVSVIRQDVEIDHAFHTLMRCVISSMVDRPHAISSGIDLVFVAKAIERIGDHAKNIAEQVVYVVDGTDVRHTALGDPSTDMSASHDS